MKKFSERMNDEDCVGALFFAKSIITPVIIMEQKAE